jgi:hypothetical protein
MVSKLRLRVLERAVDELEAEAVAIDQKLVGEIDVAESVLRAGIVAGACVHCARTGPSASFAKHNGEGPPLETVQEAAEGVLDRLQSLQELTGETGDAWAARVERLLSGDEFTRTVTDDRREAVQRRVDEVRAEVRGMVEFSR